MISYKMRCDQLKNEDIGRYIAFGIDIFQDGNPIRRIRDVSTNEKKLQKLISLLNILQLDMIHIDDIIEDFIG